MNITFDVGDIAAVLALVLSIYATIQTVRFNERQKSLIESQENLNNLLLEKEKSESQNERKANLGASFLRLGNNRFRLKVWNMGKAVAHNVNLEFPEGNEVILRSDLEEKLPMQKLDMHQSIEFIAAVHMGTKPKLAVKLLWSDAFSDNNEKVVYPTL